MIAAALSPRVVSFGMLRDIVRHGFSGTSASPWATRGCTLSCRSCRLPVVSSDDSFEVVATHGLVATVVVSSLLYLKVGVERPQRAAPTAWLSMKCRRDDDDVGNEVIYLCRALRWGFIPRRRRSADYTDRSMRMLNEVDWMKGPAAGGWLRCSGRIQDLLHDRVVGVTGNGRMLGIRLHRI